jgi:hypothetical protein
MMFGVDLAGFAGVVGGVGGVARGDVRMMASLFGVAGFMMRGGFAMVLGGFFVMVGGLGVMFVRVMGRSHDSVLSGLGARRIRNGLTVNHSPAKTLE